MRILPAIALSALISTPAFALQCGGSFSSFVSNVKTEAISRGYPASTVDGFLAHARHDPAVIRADRSQGIFRMSFLDFSRRVISQNRMDNGRHFFEQAGWRV